MMNEPLKPVGLRVVELTRDESETLIALRRASNQADAEAALLRTKFQSELNRLRLKYHTDPEREKEIKESPDGYFGWVGGLGDPSELTYDCRYLVKK